MDLDSVFWFDIEYKKWIKSFKTQYDVINPISQIARLSEVYSV